MNNPSFLTTYIEQKIQLIQVDETGKVVETNNRLLPIQKGDLLPEIHPFFESLFYIINEVQTETLFRCVEFNPNNNKLLLDVTVIKNEGLTYLLLSDFTQHYTESNTLIQEKNESVIANQKLLFEKELFTQKEKLTNTFLARLSHELRAPLSNILGIISLLQESNKLHYEDSEMLRVIKKTGNHMESLLNDLLDISKIKRGALDLKEVPFKMFSVISYITELYKPKAKRKNLDFVIKIEKDVPKNILGDPVRLRQILVNLIENALKNTLEGRIKIRIYNNGVQDDKTSICFEVSDTGVGIEKSELPKVFNEYYQLENLFGKYIGDGLGLKIVQDLVTVQGGNITVKSEKGEGTIFTACIPYKTLAKKPVDRKKYKKEDYQGILNVIKILVVDDNEIDLMILTKMLLKELYFSIDLATEVNQAYNRIQKKKPDVILLDIVLQNEEGFKLIKKLKKDKATQNIPIIAITARAMPEDKSKCEALGVSAFVTKPYDKHELITQITRLAKK